MYERRTSVSGWTESRRHVFGWLYGTWKPESALRWARRMGAIGDVSIEHRVIDHSGRGRGGHNGLWLADSGDLITLKERAK